MAKTCKKCGKRLSDDHRWCPYCGAPVKASAAEDTYYEAQILDDNGNPAKTTGGKAGKKKDREPMSSSKRRLVVYVVLGIVLVLLVRFGPAILIGLVRLAFALVFLIPLLIVAAIYLFATGKAQQLKPKWDGLVESVGSTAKLVGIVVGIVVAVLLATVIAAIASLPGFSH